MPPVLTAVGLSLLGSLGGLLVASLFLLFNARVRVRLLPWLVSYAVGAMLGVALLALLPSALEQGPARAVLASLLGGILLFFVLEKLVLWRHCHTDACEAHGSAASLILVGDAFHNFIDGVVIAAAVSSSVGLGVSTALAVAAHEIPQEVGDFAILLHGGYSRSKALLVNLVSGASAALGALLSFFMVESLPAALPYVLAVAAASLLYVAMSDLIPDLHRGRIDAGSVRQVLLIGLGLATVLAL